MNRKIKLIVFVLTLLAVQGCFLYGEKPSVAINSVIKQKATLSSELTSVDVANNLVTINGSGFQNVTSVKITGNGVDDDLSINSKSDSQIVAAATRALSLAVGETFALVIGTAEAQATFNITFTLQNGAVTASKLSTMGATSGQVLKFNGTSWAPASQVDALNFMGTWDATATIPDVTLSSSGDYYIVSVANGPYSVGDWIISDGYNWTRVPYSKTSVASFNGRKGIVTLVPADYVSLKDVITNKVTGSSINDLADIDLSTPPINGQVLKYDSVSSTWKPAADSAGAGGIVLTDLSASAPLSYNSGTGAFSLPLANVLGLPLTGLSSSTGSIAATDSILGAFGKLLNTQSDYVSASGGATINAGTIAVGGAGMITVPTATGVTATEVANVTYVNNAIAANGVWGKSGSTINYTAGNVGIGTASPASPIHVDFNNAVTSGTTYGFQITPTYNQAAATTANTDFLINRTQTAVGSGAQNYLDLQLGGVSKFSVSNYGYLTSASGASFSGVVVNGSNGSADYVSSSGAFASPTGRGGGYSATNYAPNDDYFSSIILSSRNTAGNYQTAYLAGISTTGAGSYSPALALGIQTGATSYAEVMRIHSSGNVGIGTTAPDAILHLKGAASAGYGSVATRSILESTNGDALFQTRAVAGGFSGVEYLAPNGTAAVFTGFRDSTGEFRFNNVYAGGYIDFMINSASKMRIANTGYVGIGSTNPGAALDISGFNMTNSQLRVGSLEFQPYALNNAFIGENTHFSAGAFKYTATGAAGLFYFQGNEGQFRFSPSGAAGTNLSNGGVGNVVFKANSDGSVALGGLINNLNGNYTGASLLVNSSGNVGIGTSAPSSRLHVTGVAAQYPAVRIGAGAGALHFNGTNDGSMLLHGTNGDRAQLELLTPDQSIRAIIQVVQGYGTFLQSSAGDFIVDTDFGSGSNYKFSSTTGTRGITFSGAYNAAADASIIRTSAAKLSVTGSVGVGVAPTYKLDVDGDINTSSCFRIGATTVSGVCTSDARLKENIQDYKQGLNELLGIHLRTYQFNGLGEMPKTGETAVGVIAQEVEKTNPLLVKTRMVKLHQDDEKKTAIKVVDYSKFTYMLINAVKELYHRFVENFSTQSQEIVSLKMENARLKTRSSDLEGKLNRLESENIAMRQAFCELGKMSFCD